MIKNVILTILGTIWVIILLSFHGFIWWQSILLVIAIELAVTNWRKE